MKNYCIYLISVGLLCLSACEKNFLDEESVYSKDVTADFKLVDIRKIGNLNSLRSTIFLDEWDYETYYEHVASIYRYNYYYGNANMDHYYSRTKADQLNHDGYNFTRETMEEFYVLNSNMNTGLTTLFLLYSPDGKDHILSTSRYIDGYNYETDLGYIYEKQQVGSIPLKEYYTTTRRKHLYVTRNTEIEDWLPTHDSDFKYVKTVGYVFPKSPDSKRESTQFIFQKRNDGYFGLENLEEIILTAKAYNGNDVYELEYSAKVPPTTAIVTIPNTYTVICANVKFIEKQPNSTILEAIAYDITKYLEDEESGHYDFMASYTQYPNSLIGMYRTIDGSKITYTYNYDAIVGNKYINDSK